MTSITRNLPWFVRDLGISIIGKECYISLVENLDIADVQCLKYSLSKGLGIGIVVGGSIMKVPQLLLIVNARSARGLSLPAYILETLSYAITLFYSFRHNFPFSTYGENFFLTLQNVLITLLIVNYAPSRLAHKSQKSQKLALVSISTLAGGVALYKTPQNILALLQMTTLPLSLFSKLPQIRQNYRSQSTGQLSAFAVISQIAGCLARLFTTATEVNDLLVSAGFALALMLNIILGIQLYMYWGDKHSTQNYPRSEGVELKENPYTTSWESQSQPSVYQPIASLASGTPMTPSNATHRISTPPLRAQTPTSASGRKWARKVD